MKLELLVLSITGLFIANIYYDGKLFKKSLKWKKYYKMGFYGLMGLSFYLFLKKNPNQGNSLLHSANALINVVFYEREIIDLVPRLLARCHSAAKHVSSWFVTDLVETAHVILDITEHLAEHKMFVLQRRRRMKKKIKMKPCK